MSKKKTIMRALKIDEISGVDRPAQVHARVAIMKRNDPLRDDDLSEVITKSENGLQFEASDYAYTPDLTKSETWSLRLTDTPGGMPSSTVVEASIYAYDNAEIPDDLRSAVATSLRTAWLQVHTDKTEADLPDNLKTSPKENIMDPKEAEKLKGEVETTKAELAVAKAYGELNDAEKAHYNSLDAAGKTEFIGKSASDRQSVIQKKHEADPVVYKGADGTEYRKSVGDHIVALAKRADESDKMAKAEREKRENSELQKRAGDLLPHTPGTIEERAALLKAAESIPDEAMSKKAIEALKAGDAALAPHFKPNGVSKGADPVEGSPAAQLKTLAKNYAKEHKVDEAIAEAKVLETAEGARLYDQMNAQ